MGIHPEYNPYSQGPTGPAPFPMAGGGPMDGPNGPVMGGPPGMQPPIHNGSGIGPPHGLSPMGPQLPSQAQHPIYPDFAPQSDQQMMASQQHHQHLQEQLLQGEQRGVKREGDLMVIDPSKRLASMLSQDDNALSHAPPNEDGCARGGSGAAMVAESAGTDNGSTKDDNITEKDESTQESTNTIESAKTETEDDDPSKVNIESILFICFITRLICIYNI